AVEREQLLVGYLPEETDVAIEAVAGDLPPERALIAILTARRYPDDVQAYAPAMMPPIVRHRIDERVEALVRHEPSDREQVHVATLAQRSEDRRRWTRALPVLDHVEWRHHGGGIVRESGVGEIERGVRQPDRVRQCSAQTGRLLPPAATLRLQDRMLGREEMLGGDVVVLDH